MVQKKKRRYRRKKKARKRNLSAFDRHHLCWTRRSWSNGYLNELRLHPYCVVSIPRDTIHRHIHSELCYIPVPDQSSAKFVLEHLKYFEKFGAISMDDPIEKRLLVLAALFRHSDPKTAKGFQKQFEIVCEYKSPL